MLPLFAERAYLSRSFCIEKELWNKRVPELFYRTGIISQRKLPQQPIFVFLLINDMYYAKGPGPEDSERGFLFFIAQYP